MRRCPRFRRARRAGVFIRDAEPLDLAALARASHEVHVRRPEALPPFLFLQIRQQRCPRRGFERILGAGAADEMHERVRSIVANSDCAVFCGDGNLENPDSKRNRKVFHKSLSDLWIAIVESCRKRAKSTTVHR